VFQGCTSLESITIPNSVTSIGERAFEDCSLLTNVHISDLEAWCNCQYDDFASNPFAYSSGGNLYLNGEKVTELVIPDTVSIIRSYAFSKCSSLTSVTIPNSVTSIGEYAFNACGLLTSVNISKSVTNLGFAAFYECSSLTEITYKGTVAEWRALNTQGLVGRETTVHCTDGDTTAIVCTDM
jgi:hypothetical protein